MEVSLSEEQDCCESLFYTFRPDNAEELKRRVAEAFADVAFPGEGDRDIIVSGCPGCCAECGETHALFRGKHWREFAESGLTLQSWPWGGLALLRPAAWHFYLPAYLMVSLSGGEGAENALDCVLGALTPWSSAGLAEISKRSGIDYVTLGDDWFQARVARFTVAQQECLAAFFQALSATDPEDEEWQALAAYWTGRAAAGVGQEAD